MTTNEERYLREQIARIDHVSEFIHRVQIDLADPAFFSRIPFGLIAFQAFVTVVALMSAGALAARFAG